jgi:DNA recombination protein RmuC
MLEVVAVVLGFLLLALGGLASWLMAARASAHARANASAVDFTRLEAAAARERAESSDALQSERTKSETLAQEVADLRLALVERNAQLLADQRVHDKEITKIHDVAKAQFDALNDARAKLDDQFRATASKVLGESSTDLLRLAAEQFAKLHTQGQSDIEKKRSEVDRLITPIADALKKTDEKLSAIERGHADSTTRITEQLLATTKAGEGLRAETGKLARALSEPHVRGRYGEMQLQRVAELAGMTPYCDFTTQAQSIDAEGNALRPDMVVRLPGDRTVVVDAKTNIKAYLDAINAETPTEADAALDRFAGHVAAQATALARKKYWSQYEGSPEFVVMFIPGEQFVDAALSRQPDILENAARQGVILASPSTLIGLLRAVALGFQERRLADEAAELRVLGMELHSRAAVAIEFIERLGRSLGSATEHYNSFVRSYESRLEPTLKRFEESGAKSAKELPTLGMIEARPRALPATIEREDSPLKT